MKVEKYKGGQKARWVAILVTAYKGIEKRREEKRREEKRREEKRREEKRREEKRNGGERRGGEGEKD